MNTGIHIGNEKLSDTAATVATAIMAIMAAGHEAHADQKTIRSALAAFTTTCKVDNVTLSGCTVVGDRNVTVP